MYDDRCAACCNICSYSYVRILLYRLRGSCVVTTTTCMTTDFFLCCMLLYMQPFICPHNTYVSSCYYTCHHTTICVLILLNDDSLNYYVCPHTSIYVSAYSYMCPAYVSSYSYVSSSYYMCHNTSICVFILVCVVHMCPHTPIHMTTINVSAYSYIYV